LCHQFVEHRDVLLLRVAWGELGVVLEVFGEGERAGGVRAASFDSFDLLHTGREITADKVATALITTAEHSLLR
jgi:hypothetical protein